MVLRDRQKFQQTWHEGLLLVSPSFIYKNVLSLFRTNSCLACFPDSQEPHNREMQQYLVQSIHTATCLPTRLCHVFYRRWALHTGDHPNMLFVVHIGKDKVACIRSYFGPVKACLCQLMLYRQPQ